MDRRVRSSYRRYRSYDVMAALVAVAAAALACAGCAGCGDRAESRATRAARLVVTEGALAEHVLLTGELDAVHAEVLVAPQTAMRQVSLQWMIEDGAQVEAGQKVAEFDNATLASELEERRLAVLQADNSAVQGGAASAVAVADKAFAVTRHEIALERAERQAAIGPEVYPRRVYQENQLALEKARAALEQARDELTAQKKSDAHQAQVKKLDRTTATRKVEQIESELTSLVLHAPKSGIFVVDTHPWMGRKLQVGDVLWPGFTVGKVPDLSAMQVKARLFDVDDGRIAVGMRAVCVLDAYPDLRFEGAVASITPIAREPEDGALRRIFDVVIRLEKTDPERMRPGFSVKVQVARGEPERGLLAPRAGLDLSGETPRARRWTSGRVELVEVEVGFCTAQACLVRSGLAAGDELRPASEEDETL